MAETSNKSAFDKWWAEWRPDDAYVSEWGIAEAAWMAAVEHTMRRHDAMGFARFSEISKQQALAKLIAAADGLRGGVEHCCPSVFCGGCQLERTYDTARAEWERCR